MKQGPKNWFPERREQGWLAKSPKDCLTTARKRGILIADDDGCVRALLGVGMRQQGFVVWLAASGPEALDLYWSHRASIDVVLLGVRMPDLDGPQTLAALRKLDPQVRCCFMSAYLGNHTQESLRNLGAASVFVKPFCPDEVSQVMWELASQTDSIPSSCG